MMIELLLFGDAVTDFTPLGTAPIGSTRQLGEEFTKRDAMPTALNLRTQDIEQ